MEFIHEWIGPVSLTEFDGNLYAATQTGVYMLTQDATGKQYFKLLGFQRSKSSIEVEK